MTSESAEVCRRLREFNSKDGVLGERIPGLAKCPICKGRYKRRMSGECRSCYRGWVLANED